MRSLRLLFLFGLASGFISEKVFVTPPTDDLYLEGQTSRELFDVDAAVDDDDDGEDGSGSGSGDYAHSNSPDKEEKLLNFSLTTVSQELLPSHPEPSAASPLMTGVALPNGGNSSEVVGPTADWLAQSTSPNSTNIPPRDTSPTHIAEVDHADKENSLDRWDVSTPKNRADETQIELVENEIVAEKGRNGRLYEIDTPEEVSSENMWERTDVLAAVIACGVVGFLCAVFLLLLLTYRMKKKDEGSYELGDAKVSTTAYQKAPTKEFYA